jgi:hypothetical protein
MVRMAVIIVAFVAAGDMIVGDAAHRVLLEGCCIGTGC